jgi:hypothetical protein
VILLLEARVKGLAKLESLVFLASASGDRTLKRFFSKLLEVCPSGPGGELASAVAGQVMLLTVGLIAPEPRYRKRPDQLPQGVAGLADAPWGTLFAVVDAA